MEKRIVELENKLARLEKLVLALADLVPDERVIDDCVELCEEHKDDVDPVSFSIFRSDYGVKEDEA